MNLLGKIERWIIVIAFMIATAAVVFQVANRNIFHLSVPWTEELARYLIIWVALLGGAYGFRNRAHISIDAVVLHYSPKLKFLVSLISDIITILFSLIIVFYSAQVVIMQLQSGQLSASLRWVMGYIYLALPVGYGLTILEVVFQMVNDIKMFRQGGEQK